VTDDLEKTARRIAQRGRQALLTRLRPAFEEALAAHADVLQLDEQQLKQMINRAADRADGLQWRRALATVASEELGIGLGDALAHPAVARAQAILGVPSYEESLAKLGAVAQAEEQPGEDEQAGDDAQKNGEAAAEDGQEAPAVEEAKRAAFAGKPDKLKLSATHVGGIAQLEPGEAGIELEFSSHGLDIMRGGDANLGRLTWAEMHALQVPEPRGWRRRRRQQDAALVVQTEYGEASFEVPGMSVEELRDQLEPMRRYM
jgi:hypothetical protein